MAGFKAAYGTGAEKVRPAKSGGKIRKAYQEAMGVKEPAGETRWQKMRDVHRQTMLQQGEGKKPRHRYNEALFVLGGRR